MKQRRLALGGQRKQNRAEYLASVALLKANWVACNRAVTDDVADQHASDEGGGEGGGAPTYTDRIGNDLWQNSTPKSLLCPDLLLQEASRIAGPNPRED